MSRVGMSPPVVRVGVVVWVPDLGARPGCQTWVPDLGTVRQGRQGRAGKGRVPDRDRQGQAGETWVTRLGQGRQAETGVTDAPKVSQPGRVSDIHAGRRQSIATWSVGVCHLIFNPLMVSAAANHSGERRVVPRVASGNRHSARRTLPTSRTLIDFSNSPPSACDRTCKAVTSPLFVMGGGQPSARRSRI